MLRPCEGACGQTPVWPLVGLVRVRQVLSGYCFSQDALRPAVHPLSWIRLTATFLHQTYYCMLCFFFFFEHFDSFLRNPESVERSSTGKHPSLMLGFRPLEIKGCVVSFLPVCPFSIPFPHLCTSYPSLFLYGFQPSQAALGTDICNHCSIVHICGKFISSHISCKCSWCRMNTLGGSEANKWDAKLAYNKPLSWSICGSSFCLKLWGQLEASSGTWQSTPFLPERSDACCRA